MEGTEEKCGIQIHSFTQKSLETGSFVWGDIPPGEPRFFRSPSRNFATAQNDMPPLPECLGFRMTSDRQPGLEMNSSFFVCFCYIGNAY
jgi:hypothetical protein